MGQAKWQKREKAWELPDPPVHSPNRCDSRANVQGQARSQELQSGYHVSRASSTLGIRADASVEDASDSTSDLAAEGMPKLQMVA